MRASAAAVVGAVLWTCASASVARADGAAAKARADQLFADGRRYLGNKDYAVACAAFEESQGLDPAIGTQLNIALCYEQWGHVAAAYRAYVEAERLARLKFDDRAKGARDKVDALALTVPHLRIDLPEDADPAAIVVLDGKEVDKRALANDVLVEAGPHVIEARVPGGTPVTTKVDIKLAEHKRVTIEAARKQHVVAGDAPAGDHRRMIAGVALTGAGTLAVGIGIALAVAARSDYETGVSGHCMAGVCDPIGYTLTSDARSRANAMSFVVGGGVVAAGIGVYLLVTQHAGDHGASAPAGVSIAPTFGNGGVGLAIGGAL